ncbi:MAG: membrane protein of unknown function [Promethearchaeota archaeon]|nr:MAG: membrane protein of unknown function [Candidatus Lokiarchaeota archaeon]
MKILTGFVFIINLILWIVGILLAFSYEGGLVGFPATIGFIGFHIAWYLSGGVIIAPADYFFQPIWSVFLTKLKWSNSTGIIVGFIAYLIIYSIF